MTIFRRGAPHAHIKKLILGAAVAFGGPFAAYAAGTSCTVHYDANGAEGTVPSDDTVELSSSIRRRMRRGRARKWTADPQMIGSG